jgi:hypothetical protein
LDFTFYCHSINHAFSGIPPAPEGAGFVPVFYMKTHQSKWGNFTRSNANERGEGLLPVLLAVAITAMVAAGISSVVIGARDKSVASQLCNVVRQVQDAKQRYLLDNPTVSETVKVLS